MLFRSPEWKLIMALEPDFHFKPELELYNLVQDPLENNNVADKNPEVVAMLKKRMYDWIAKREAEVGRTDPIYRNFLANDRPFKSSQEAYEGKYIGGIQDAVKLQKQDK